jgi:SulP family sulfate permease
MRAKKNILRLTTLKGDLMGGMTAAIIALPMGLAFGVQSGLGAAAGLYTAIVLVIVASIFGGTKSLISDPTGPMTVVAATVVSAAVAHAGSLEQAWFYIIVTFFLAGAFQVLFGLLGLAQYIRYMPYPVVSGFMGGIGVIIIVYQLFPLMGHSSPKGIFNVLGQFSEAASAINLEATLLGLGTIAVIYLLPRVTKKVPSVLVALILGSLAAYFLGLNVPMIGEIPAGIPELHLEALANPDFSDLSFLLIPAITLAGLGCIDTLLTSVVADNLTATKHNGRRELIGQGVGNMLVALLGGIPGAGATMGTVTSIRTGGVTPLSGIFKGIFLIAILAGVGKLVAFIPIPVLAGILITVGLGIIDYKGIRLLLRVPRADAAVLILVLFITIFDNLLDAVAAGSIISAMLFMKKMADTAEKNNRVANLHEMGEAGKVVQEEIRSRIFVETLDGPLFFGFADQFREMNKALRNMDAVIFRMERVPFADESGLLTLEESLTELEKHGVAVFVTGANRELRVSLHKLGMLRRVVLLDSSRGFNDCLLRVEKKIRE